MVEIHILQANMRADLALLERNSLDIQTRFIHAKSF